MSELTQSPSVSAAVERLTTIAAAGLRAMLLTPSLRYPQTARLSADAQRLDLEGTNPRYAAIAALGLSHLDLDARAAVLQGHPVAGLVGQAVEDALAGADPGAIALAAWAAAETGCDVPEDLGRRLTATLGSAAPIPTVDFSWSLAAAVAAPGLVADDLVRSAARRLLAAQGARGIFPHALPPGSQGRWRAHVGCFADQVYPIQALARYAVATGDGESLTGANRCADRIVELQGAGGQWWWHYDARTGDVIEGFPVYSVHQHAMGPMALFDLAEAGGADHRAAVALGLGWIDRHPESTEALIHEPLGVVWRKVGRRERRKVVRSVRAVTTSVRPGLRLGVLDGVFPPGPVDHECRPYELGWLLYAWGAGGVVERLSARARRHVERPSV